MKRARAAVLLALCVAIAGGAVRAQVCSDHDGDGDAFGLSCSTSTDCEDRSWSQSTAAAETCDGLDNDCDAGV